MSELNDFAKWYAQAWCGRDPERVAAFFAENGSLTVNDATPAQGSLRPAMMRAFKNSVQRSNRESRRLNAFET
jgi:hypothetical protein